jgi:hypothetical protein
MFVRLTKPMRAKAGWFATLIYLFCVLAPGAALALGDAASCLTAEDHTATATHQHEQTSPVQATGAWHLHHEAQADHYAGTGPGMDKHSQHHHGGKTSPGPCCAVFCLSAIASDPPTFAKPPQPISVCISESFQRLSSKTPPLLYRPPIA